MLFSSAVSLQLLARSSSASAMASATATATILMRRGFAAPALG